MPHANCGTGRGQEGKREIDDLYCSGHCTSKKRLRGYGLVARATEKGGIRTIATLGRTLPVGTAIPEQSGSAAWMI